MYDEVGEPATERRLPDGGVTPGDVARWSALAPAYGLRIVGPPIAPGSLSCTRMAAGRGGGGWRGNEDR